MADEEENVGSGPIEDAHGRVAGDDSHVDESQLKLPTNVVMVGREASGEEQEEVLCKVRGKLFVSINKEWKERATGDFKILRNPAGKCRLIVRQEKMLYLRANHLIPDVDLKEFGANSWCWTAVDFSSEATGKSETLAARFRDAEVAGEFKKTWNAARAANKAVGTSESAVVFTGNKVSAPTFTSAGGAAIGAGAGGAAVTPAVVAAKPAAVDTSGPIPVVDNLANIYGAEKSAELEARYAALTQAFKAKYNGAEPDFFVRAPGRVNLIGEHIDYHGYSVLPMALQTQDVVIAVSTSAASAVGSDTNSIVVANANPRWEMGTLPLDPSVEVNRAVHKWFNYVHCGYKGAFDAAKKKGLPAKEPVSIRLMIDGAVPPGAGVSSSSALVVASLLAVAKANGFSEKFTRADLGEGGRACELHIGTMSGGMDQAISAMGVAGSASRVDFEPLSAHSVTLPKASAFVVANSLEVSAKAEESEKRYNMRVTEGKLAAKLVAKGEGVATWKTIVSFRHLQETMKLPSPGAIVPAIEKHLKPVAYNQIMLAEAFGESLPGLFEGDDKRNGALKVLQAYSPDAAVFELLKRARHVCSEAERVWQFQYAAEGKGIEGGEEAQLKRLGELMVASQSSCRDDYECSSPGLDTLCALAMASGASGARLTGAGWGGCAVFLVHKDQVGTFMEKMKAYGPYVGKEADFINQSLFASAPGSGAAVYQPSESFEV